MKWTLILWLWYQPHIMNYKIPSGPPQFKDYKSEESCRAALAAYKRETAKDGVGAGGICTKNWKWHK